jgi:parvulin-like peptidyl-prolyl isomerase
MRSFEARVGSALLSLLPALLPACAGGGGAPPAETVVDLAAKPNAPGDEESARDKNTAAGRDQGERVVERPILEDGELQRIERIRYDARGNEVEVAYVDDEGRPVVGPNGTAGYRVAYDERDRPLEKAYFGADGRPVANRDGSAFVRYVHEGGTPKEEHFDLDGKPAPVLFGAKHLLVMYQGSMRAKATITRTKEEARARAEEARKKILAGMSFTDAVATYSDEPGAASRGGDLGGFKKGQMVLPFQRAVEATEVGRVSDVFETPFGFHVLVRTR